MADQSKADELAQVISDLQQERQHHLDEIERIDATFEQYGIDPESLGGSASGGRSAARRGSGRPTKKKTSAAGRRGTQASRRKKSGKKKRGRRSFSQTGEESVLAFVKSHGGPTAKEVNQHWQSEGRGGKADNALGKLVAEGRLRRVQNKEGRGSLYRPA